MTIQQQIEQEAERLYPLPFRRTSYIAFREGAKFALSRQCVKVEASMPDEGQKVYAYNGHHQIACKYEKGAFKFGDIKLLRVTHWTSQLPDPEK